MEKIPDPEQSRVIEDLSSNLLLLAGAGTGKTFTVARRVRRILEEGLADPSEILCLTFTIKACNEMRDDLLPVCPAAAGVEVRTIHGFCRKIVAEEGKRAGVYERGPAVCDEVDEEEILQRLFSECIPAWDAARVAADRYSLTPAELRLRDVAYLGSSAPLTAAGVPAGFYRRMDDGSYLGSEGILTEDAALPLLRATDPGKIVCPDCGGTQTGNGNFCRICGFDFRTYFTPARFSLGKYGRYRDLVSLLKHERARVPRRGNVEKDYAEAFSRLKERDPEGLKRVFTYRMGYEERFDRVFYGKAERYIGALMREYRACLDESCRLDFDDLVIGARDLLLEEEICARWQARYRFIIVDETQDTSALEYDVLRRLFPRARVMMCGDFFQTIYEWRGSRPRDVIEDFRKNFGAKTYCLTENYRATRKLAGAAFGFLCNAFGAETETAAVTARSGEEGEPVRLVQCFGEDAEAEFIFRYFLGHREENACVMARSNRYLDGLFRSFGAFNESLPAGQRIPFFTAGDLRLFKSAVAKDMLALFSLLADPYDAIAAERIAERCLRGVGPATLAAVREGGKTGLSFSSFLEEATYAEGDPLRPLLRAAEEGATVIYDTETTGLDLARDCVIQIAAVREGKEGREEFMRFVLPEREISEGALRTHGYSEEYLRAHGAVSQRDALAQFSDFVRGCVLVGHNGKQFDRPLLDRSLRDCGLPSLPVAGEYDTLLLSRLLLPGLPDHKLSTLCAALGVTNERAHDAFADVAATADVLGCLLGRLRPQTAEREKLVRRCKNRFAPLFRAYGALSEALGDNDPEAFFGRAEEEFSFSSRCKKVWERETPAALRLLAEEKMEKTDLKGALASLLEESALSGGAPEALADGRKKAVITVHQSKGCEFDTVFLAGCDNTLFPLASAVESGREEEERRLFYVAMTRAKKKLFLTCRGGGYREPSPYFSLIPEELSERYFYRERHTEEEDGI